MTGSRTITLLETTNSGQKLFQQRVGGSLAHSLSLCVCVSTERWHKQHEKEEHRKTMSELLSSCTTQWRQDEEIKASRKERGDGGRWKGRKEVIKGAQAKGWAERDRWRRNPKSSRGEEMKSRFNEGGVEVGPVTDWCHYKLLELSMTAFNDAGVASVSVSPLWSFCWGGPSPDQWPCSSAARWPSWPVRPVKSLEVIDLVLPQDRRGIDFLKEVAVCIEAQETVLFHTEPSPSCTNLEHC